MSLTFKDIDWNLFLEELEEHSPAELRHYMLQIFTKLRDYYKNEKEVPDRKRSKMNMEWVENDAFVAEICIDRIWEMLNSGYWKDVPINYRYSYSICSVLKGTLLELATHEETVHLKVVEKFKDIIQQIDKGLLLGAPLPRMPNLLTEIASKLNKRYLSLTESVDASSSIIKIDKESLCTTLFPGFSPIPHFTKPSMEKFYCDVFKPKLPAILEGCIEHWNALDLWQNVEYLKRIAGNRTVPIEIGSRYTEDDWTQSLVTFSDFLNTHISKKNGTVGYLAQHQLFDQIPELKNDFSIPDYCSFSDKEEDSEDLPDINAWFGPANTVSPLHYDPKNNLLCQVFGYKRVILYSPEDNDNVYPYEARMLCNTAKVDPYNPNFEEYPNFQKAKGLMCYLKPGDMLFIPPKWWHHVVGLTPSFSISFWWE